MACLLGWSFEHAVTQRIGWSDEALEPGLWVDLLARFKLDKTSRSCSSQAVSIHVEVHSKGGTYSDMLQK